MSVGVPESREPAVAGLNAEMCDQTTSPTRFFALDAIRCLAVSLVLMRHMTPAPESSVIRVIFDAGWVGVDIFFALSGYLIGGLLRREAMKTGGVDIRRFLTRRGLKIYPSFFLFVLVYGLFEWRAGYGFTASEMAAEVTLTRNYFPGIWNHTWSLCVEEHFYILITALACIACLAQRGRLPLRFILCLTCAVGLLRAWLEYRFGGVSYMQTHVRIDSLLIGVLYAHAADFRLPRVLASNLRWLWLLAGPVLLLPLVFPHGHSFWAYGGYSLYAAAACFLLHAALGKDEAFRRVWFLRCAAFIGTFSYPIYLWHMPAKRALSLLRKRHLVELPWVLEFVTYCICAVALGIAMGYLVEAPVLKVRDRLFPRRVQG